MQPGTRRHNPDTDGIVEARSRPDDPDSEFGRQRLLDFFIHHSSQGLAVPDLLRRLIRSIVAHHHGHLLLRASPPDARVGRA